MLENPFQSPKPTHLDPMVEMRLSYAVNNESIRETARLFAVSRMEIYGALAGLTLLLAIAIYTIAFATPTTGLFGSQFPASWAIGIAIVFTAIAGSVLFRGKRLRALATMQESILQQQGTRSITITTKKLIVSINGLKDEWPMKHVRYLDRKRDSFGGGKKTLLQLSTNLPLAIPDNGEFENIERDRFLRLLKQRCKNVCVL